MYTYITGAALSGRPCCLMPRDPVAATTADLEPKPGSEDVSASGMLPEAEARFGALCDIVRTTRPKEDLAVLRRAFEYAAWRHAGQRRKSGEPYILHPIEVAILLAEQQMDSVCLQTALLHDVVEDTKAKLEEVQKSFGEEVARCVDGVTKLRKLKFHSREERQAESVRKMLLAMVTDIRVILVKLADRLHNLRTLDALSREQQERIAHETLEIYSPIAHRLGMGKVRAELEDLAFRYLDPDAYAEIIAGMESRRHANEEFLANIKATVEQKLAAEGIPAHVEGRLKRPYSIYLKLKRQKISMDQVYDLLALRIITESVKDCYAALGVIHNEWHPIPGRIKDHIAIPRPNLYQSLHTSVIGPGGQAFEVQIRTWEMHRIAEEGIAAHWKYKEGRKGETDDDQRVAWLRRLVEWQREMRDSGDFMSTLRVELYPEDVYTFTPKGKVIALPREATPIDFAYAIHSDVGHTCVGAKVNGRIVPLKYQLKNGDVVEILRQPGHLPSKDWLALVKTARARNKIRHVINQQERAKAIEIGQKYLEREARRLGVALSRVSKAEWDRVIAEYGVGKMEELHAALGFGKFSARQILHKLAPDVVKEKEEAPVEERPSAPTPPSPGAPETGDLVLRVKGVDDLLVYRAKCCNPIRGERIVGYVTRGKGVAVHSLNCPNVQSLMYEVERKIDVEWGVAGGDQFAVRLLIHTDDRPGMLHKITSVFFDEDANIRTLEARRDEKVGDVGVVDLTVEVKDQKQLARIVTAARRIAGVRDVERVQ